MNMRAHSSTSAGASSSSASFHTKSLECHICLEDLRSDLGVCPCGHVFHEACIAQALDVNKQCPICRRHAAPTAVIRLFLEVPDLNEPSAPSPTVETAADLLARGTHDSLEPQVARLNQRVSDLVERLQWQKKQYDMLVTKMKRARHQAEQLIHDKQALVQRVSGLEANKSELLSKVAKYQVELSRLAENARQMAVNQSIINYLNTCDSGVLEDEIQNPRELVVALKKACKFRHDQYQKAVKEKAKLKSMVQSLQQQQTGIAVHSGSVASSSFSSSSSAHRGLDDDRTSAQKLERKRAFTAADYVTPHTTEAKKRKVAISPAGMSLRPEYAGSSVLTPIFAPRPESSSFRASAYSDVPTRPPSSTMTQPRSILKRSSYNPSQYGSYNLTPSSDAPVQSTDSAVCRRGYDETGRLTNFFLPKEVKRSVRAHPNQVASVRSSHMPLVSASSTMTAPSAASASNHRPSTNRPGFPLTAWLRNGD